MIEFNILSRLSYYLLRLYLVIAKKKKTDSHLWQPQLLALLIADAQISPLILKLSWFEKDLKINNKNNENLKNRQSHT